MPRFEHRPKFLLGRMHGKIFPAGRHALGIGDKGTHCGIERTPQGMKGGTNYNWHFGIHWLSYERKGMPLGGLVKVLVKMNAALAKIVIEVIMRHVDAGTGVKSLS